jgi:hypothetical protein
VASLLSTMAATGADYTNTFRGLMLVVVEEGRRRAGSGVAGSGGGSSGAGAAPSPSSSATSSDDTGSGDHDPALAYLLSQTATARELEAATQPALPLGKLQRVLALAEANPALGVDVGEVRRELAKHAAWGALQGRSDEAKAAADAAAWRAWLAAYRARLAQEEREAEGGGEGSSGGPSAARGGAGVAVAGSSQPGGPGGGSTHADGLPEGAAGEAAAAAAALRQRRRRRADARHAVMARANPVFVLRNWVAHVAIQAAEAGDYAPVRALLARLQDPFGLRDGSGGGSGGVGGGGGGGAATVGDGSDGSGSGGDSGGAATVGDHSTSRAAAGRTTAAAAPPVSCRSAGWDFSARPPAELLDLKVT